MDSDRSNRRTYKPAVGISYILLFSVCHHINWEQLSLIIWLQWHHQDSKLLNPTMTPAFRWPCVNVSSWLGPGSPNGLQWREIFADVSPPTGNWSQWSLSLWRKTQRVGWDVASVMSHIVHLNYNIYFPVREQFGWDGTRGWAAVREQRAPSSGREAALQHYLNFFLQVFNETKKIKKALFLTALSSMFRLIRPNLSICAFSDCKK